MVLRLTLLLALVALLAASSATAAATATPAQYRAKVNAICRSYTPLVKNLGSSQAALQKLLTLGLAQDRKIEAQPVPAALRSTMQAILARLRKIDAQVVAALAAGKAGNQKAMLAHTATIGTLATPLDRWFDAAGLSYCGSKQS